MQARSNQGSLVQMGRPSGGKETTMQYLQYNICLGDLMGGSLCRPRLKIAFSSPLNEIFRLQGKTCFNRGYRGSFVQASLDLMTFNESNLQLHDNTP